MDKPLSSEQILPKEYRILAACQHNIEQDMLEKDNVVGIAIGNKVVGDQTTSEKCLSVLVSHKLDRDMLDSRSMVDTSKKIDGMTIDVVEVGDLFAGEGSFAPPVQNFVNEDSAFDGPIRQDVSYEIPTQAFAPSLNVRARPALGGYSVGHYKITAGTIATACYDRSDYLSSRPGSFYILSNNHVLANSNAASIGDPILQPGPYDGGTYPRDMIARLKRYIPIKFHSGLSRPLNYVDAAIAEGNFRDLSREIYWIGYVDRTYSVPSVGLPVEKTGRTTGFRTGRITNINATVDVNYGGGRIARFARQIVTTNISAGGDSGSLVLNRQEGAVGLLFAGSSTRTIVNNIALVQNLLKIRLTEM